MKEQLQDLTFPSNGLDLTAGFGAQRPGTTSVGLNVRTFEPGTQRGRGGSRQGLVRYVLPQLPTAAKIQCLDYIVDPSADALLANFGNGNFNDPGVLDPSTNPPGSDPTNPLDPRVRNRGNTWRTGGSGIQPNRNVRLTLNNPYSGTIAADPTTQTSDGSPVTIAVNVLDRYDFPVEGDTIVLSTSPSGRVGDGDSGTTDGFGNVEFIVSDTTDEGVVYTARDTTKNFTIGSTNVTYGGISVVQGISIPTVFGSSLVTASAAFAQDVMQGDLLLVYITAQAQGGYSAPTLSDSQGNSYTLVGSKTGPTGSAFMPPDSPADSNQILLYAATVSANGPCTVTTSSTPSSLTLELGLACFEFSGTDKTKHDGTTSSSQESMGAGLKDITAGTIGVSGNGELAIAAFYWPLVSNLVDFNQLGNFNLLPTLVTGLSVVYSLNNSTPVSTALKARGAGSANSSDGYAAIGVSYKP